MRAVQGHTENWRVGEAAKTLSGSLHKAEKTTVESMFLKIALAQWRKHEVEGHQDKKQRDGEEAVEIAHEVNFGLEPGKKLWGWRRKGQARIGNIICRLPCLRESGMKDTYKALSFLPQSHCSPPLNVW